MEKFDLNNIFQGISTLLQSDPSIMYARIGLILLGILLVYLGRRGILEPLVMIPMGLGMAAVNAGVLIMPGGVQGNLFLDPMVTDTDQLMNILQIDFLQPVYTFMFSNGLIACLIFMGIGTMLDINFLLAKPLQSMFLALCAELGTFAVVPIAFAMGLSPNDSASIAMVGGADGPMVLFASLNLSKSIFVPITVVAYLYLGLTYGGYPYLVRAMVPKRLRAIKMQPPKKAPKQYSAATKISLAVVMCVILCLLFPVAAPLFFSLFIGIVIKESGLKHVCDFISGPMLYGSTFFLGILLGILCDAHTLLDPTVLKLLVLGILALLISGIGGILGGYAMYFLKRGNFNPVIGIAAVSLCFFPNNYYNTAVNFVFALFYASVSIHYANYHYTYDQLYLRLNLAPQADADTDPNRMDLEDLIGGLLEIEEDELFQQAQNYMASSSPFLNPNFSRQDLVRALGTNEKYLSTSIKDKLNITLKEYIDRYRVNHARTELLMPGDSRSMEEIAVGAGFTSSRTFSRIFQKILGVTPAQYRRQAQ